MKIVTPFCSPPENNSWSQLKHYVFISLLFPSTIITGQVNPCSNTEFPLLTRCVSLQLLNELVRPDPVILTSSFIHPSTYGTICRRWINIKGEFCWSCCCFIIITDDDDRDNWIDKGGGCETVPGECSECCFRLLLTVSHTEENQHSNPESEWVKLQRKHM